jgi:DNA-binding HxlR family transcriptional regulator
MKNQTIGPAGSTSLACNAFAEHKQVVATALTLLSGKWKGEILMALVDGTRRFGELRRAIPGVTQHMLTVQLRELEADGLVTRTIYAEVPPRVEYRMTPAAEALRPVFLSLLDWWQAHGRLAAERAASDDAAA